MTQFEVVLINMRDEFKTFGWVESDHSFGFSQVGTIPISLFVIKMEVQFYQVPSLLNCIVKKLRMTEVPNLSGSKIDSVRLTPSKPKT